MDAIFLHQLLQIRLLRKDIIKQLEYVMARIIAEDLRGEWSAQIAFNGELIKKEIFAGLLPSQIEHYLFSFFFSVSTCFSLLIFSHLSISL